MKKISSFVVVFVTAILAFGNIRITSEKSENNSDSLVAYFPFNGNANDESGNGHDGTVYGGILTEDRNAKPDNAYTFPNLHDQIILANTSNLNLQAGFTLNAWIKYKNVNCGIVGKHNCWIPNGFLLGIEDGQFTLWISNGGWQIIKTNETFEENKWYMISAVYDSVNKTGLVYIDGKLKASDYALYTNFNAASITISEASGGCPNGNMPGVVDEVKIYNRPLTAEEIQVEYNISFTGLVAYYPFNGNANDESGNKNNGTIIGALTPTADRYGLDGKAYKFWHPDYISVPTNSSFFTNEFTVSYWYKVASYWGERGVLSCVGKNGGYQQYYVGTNFAYLIGYNFPHENSHFSSNYTVSDAPNTWHYVTATYQKIAENSSVSKFYINGELKKTDNQPVAIAYPGEEKFNIGKNVDVNFNGELDDIRFYDKTLTDQEIKDLYLTETKPFLLNPANQSSVTTFTPEIFWSSPLVNAEFRFQLSSDSLFGTILHEQVTTDLKTQIPDALLTEGQNYYWRVRTTLNGETGPWSTVWSFNFVNTGLEKPIMEDVSLRLSPNPANASTKIIYSLPETGINGAPVTVEIVNSIGKCIKKLSAENMSGGNNETEVETGSFQSGIYYCRLKAGNISIVRKLVIIH